MQPEDEWDHSIEDEVDFWGALILVGLMCFGVGFIAGVAVMTFL